MGDIPNKESAEHLIPGIVGAIMLVISPLYKDKLPGWFFLIVSFFLVLTSIIFLSGIFIKPYAHPFYIVRHVIGIVVLSILVFVNVRLFKQFK